MYSSLKDCVLDLESTQQLLRIQFEVDPYLEMAEIHRRIHAAHGPAILFENIKGTRFPALSNLYGTKERVDYLFSKTLPIVKALGILRDDPMKALKQPGKYLPFALKARFAVPRKKTKSQLNHLCKISDLPKILSWPKDGGPFVLLPQVLSLPPGSTDLMKSNLGMYRIQLSGNDYITNQEIGLHYQIHRGIGVHHQQYIESKTPFKISIFIGGPPSHALSAIFPLPEGMSELTFAGLLNGNRFTYTYRDGYYISNQADFVITGSVDPALKKPEGPFGDHLGYYSLRHDFPVIRVDKVYHRPDAIWHFTVVGRPPQEDSYFGYLIHQVVGDLIPKEFPGLKKLHAVDVAGVHPLLLAIGSERYMPFRERKPEEILTMANRILGTGQTSLAKFLMILSPDHQDDQIDIYNYPQYFEYFLSRIDHTRDLHFITHTTIDTLDYSGEGWNAGSKVTMACCGDTIRKLSTQLPIGFSLPDKYKNAKFFYKGILIIESNPFTDYATEKKKINELCLYLSHFVLEDIPWIVLCDDADFTGENWSNFLWVTFTRTNPSHDLYGVNEFIEYKHWGCTGPLLFDARKKPHHAPVLETDPTVCNTVDRYFAAGGPLYGFDKSR